MFTEKNTQYSVNTAEKEVVMQHEGWGILDRIYWTLNVSA